MIVKGLVATTKIDRHNTIIAKEALEQAALDINTSPNVPSVGVEHDPTILPIGKVIRANVIRMDDGEFGLYAEQDMFETHTTVVDGQTYVILKSEIDNRPFISKTVESDKMLIQTDFINFNSVNECNEFFRSVEKDFDVETGLISRKSLIPDPELTFQFLDSTVKLLLLYLASKKTVEKIGDHIIDNALNELDRIYEIVKQTIVRGAKYLIPKNRPITYIFSGNIEYPVELIVQTSDSNIAIKSLGEGKLEEALKEIRYIEARFSGLKKVQLVYNINNQCWEFNYLTTDKGEVIGTETSFRTSAKKIDIAFHEKKDLSES